MVSKEMVKMLNDQINMELFSGYMYLDIANYYAQEGLDGFAHWFTLQAGEEYGHAEKIRLYLLENNKEIALKGIDDPSKAYKNHLEPLKAGLAHEKAITASIDKLYKAAKEKDDYRTTDFLVWFVNEQMEEEASFTTLIDKYELFNKNGAALYILDQEFGARTAAQAPVQA